jgi:hypothetical protein
MIVLMILLTGDPAHPTRREMGFKDMATCTRASEDLVKHRYLIGKRFAIWCKTQREDYTPDGRFTD